MAEIKITADTSEAKSALSALQADIKNLQTAASQVKIEIKANGIEALDNDVLKTVKAMSQLANASAKQTNAQARLAEANIKLRKSNNDVTVSANKRAAAEAKEAEAYNKRIAAQSNATATSDRLKIAIQNETNEQIKLERQNERTRQSEIDLQNTQQKGVNQTERYAQQQKKAAEATKETGDAADQAKSKLQGFVSTFVKSAVIYQAIYAIRQAFMDALDTMKEVDSQLVTVRKVTQATESEISAMREKAYATASKYGIGAEDYLESVANFARAGYRDMSDSLAELSTKTQIVGDTTAEVANQFLLSMDAAYQYEGSVEKLTRVLDGANEIDNNYATSIQKIAEGLGLIAPIASQVHVTEAELTAAIGTITAVTQRSGAEASRSLRALFLNIIGDTKTEIEDGVTATEESVSALQKLLQRYAPDAVAAAKATGQIIDPMEAIGALSQSMKDGLLTEQELMEQLSALGGKLRTSQLTALVSNWDMYQDMLVSYADSVGSADREVENALDSWERKTAILANTWTEFIQKSINTDFAKGFLDGLTNAIKIVGDLGGALMTLGGYFVALKLPAIIDQFKQFGTAVSSTFKAFKSGEGNVTGVFQIIIAGATTAIAAIKGVYNAHTEQLKKAADEARERADAAVTEAEDIQKAYQAYEDANQAYEDGKISKEELTTATNDLVTALGLEKGAVDDTAEAYKNATKEALELEKVKVVGAKNALNLQFEDELNNPYNERYQANAMQYLTGRYGSDLSRFGIGMQWSGGEADYKIKDKAKALSLLKLAYKDAQKVENDYNTAVAKHNHVSREQTEEYKQAIEFMSRYGEVLSSLIGYDEQISELEDLINGKRSESTQNAEDALTAEETAVKLAAESWHTLKEAVDEATAAIQKYKDSTATEKTDAYSGYASIYEDFLTDWEAGLKGSNKVNAAIDALLPDSVINDLRRKGKSAGELLASDFYQQIFTYIDENGSRAFTKGEDSGSILAYYLWDHDEISQYQEDGSKVIKLGDEVVATMRQTWETLSDGTQQEKLELTVDDFDKLSDALYDLTGYTFDPHLFAAMMEALGIVDEKTKYAVDDLKDLAASVQALNDMETIDLEKFVQGQVQLGEDSKIIWDMVDALIEANNKGEIKLETEAGSIDEAVDKVAELIGERDKFGDTPFEAQTDEAVSSIDEATSAAERFVNNGRPYTATITVNDNATSTLQTAIGLVNAFNTSVSLASAGVSSLRNASLTVNAVTGGGRSFAVGTKNAPGGITLVNEQGPEVIQEGPYARIAGSGKPTLTWVDPGATVFTATETRQILGGADPSMLYDGINAYAGGKASGITRWRATTTTAAQTAAGTSVGASAGQGSSRVNTSTLKSTSASSSSSGNSDSYLQQLKDIVSLRESELSLLQAQEASVKVKVAKQQQVQNALMNEINYLRSIGGSQEEINKLYEQWYKINKDIADLQDEMYNELQTAIDNQIEKLNKKREEEKQLIQDQIDAMEDARNTRDEQLELEEKILAVHKADQALQNAMTERTVRWFNSVTGQWEWAANATNVKSAAEALESAQKALADYQEEKAYQAAVNELKAQQDAIDKKYDDLENRWQKVIDSMQAPVKSIDEALDTIAKNYLPSMQQDVAKLNQQLAQFGYYISSSGTVRKSASSLPVYDSGGILSGIGGIKATSQNEMIVPSDITAKMLTPNADNMFAARMSELRYLYGAGTNNGMVNSISNSIGSQYNGDLYTFGNVTLTRQQAESTSVAELARLSRNLRLYSSAM